MMCRSCSVSSVRLIQACNGDFGLLPPHPAISTALSKPGPLCTDRRGPGSSLAPPYRHPR